MSFRPTESQLKAITFPPSPLLIIAGAGTGKTTTLILRIQHLIDARIAESENIVVLTFTERAADELSLKIHDRLGDRADDMMISTFHSFCSRLVREYSDSPDAEKLLMEENDITFLLLNRFDDLTFLTSHSLKSDPVRAVLQSFIPFFNRIRDELLTPEEMRIKSSEFRLSPDNLQTHFPGLSDKTDREDCVRQFDDLLKVFERYQTWKKELGVVDYADMILDCWKMLNDVPDILRQIRQRFRHIIIDEYQDNNYALNRIVNLVAGDHPSITVVGDEDQCIYSFRGANYYNILDFRKRYGVKPNDGQIPLEDNHRSTQEILDLANVSIAHDRVRTQKNLRSANNRHGPKPVWHVGNRRQILAEIPLLVNDFITRGPYGYGDIAVLCRTWNQAKEAAKALQEFFIPADIFAERFFGIPAVKSVLAWGDLITGNSRSESALFRLLTEHRASISRGVFKHIEEAETDDPLELLRNYFLSAGISDMEKKKVQWISDTVRDLRRKARQNQQADEMVWEILKATDILGETRHGYRYAHRLALANVGYLMTLAERFAGREDQNTLDRWLHYMNVLALQNSLPAVQPEFLDPRSAVQVMTVHKSKGLEFPVVIIPFLRFSSFPLRYKPSLEIDRLPDSWYNWPKPENLTPEEEHLNEERRTFYVAVTRAKEEVHLFGPEKASSVLIREIQELSEEYMERKDMLDTEEFESKDIRSELRRKLLVELNREISARQYDNAQALIEGMRILEENGRLPEDHPYAYLPQELTDSPEEPVEPLTDLLALSASKVEEYDTCPYKYRLSKIDKVPERKSRPEMEFGDIIHRVLEEFHGSEDQSLDFLLALFEKKWRSEAFEYLLREEEFKRQGEQLLRDYFRFLQTNPSDIVAREARFDFTIDEMQVRIVGKIDRIDREGEELAVIDYKTSKSKQKANTNLQLALYTEALRLNAVKDVKGTPGPARLHFLRHPEEPVESHTFSPKDLSKHLERVENAARGIRKQEFNTKRGWHCNTCDYKDFLCPAWEDR